MVGKYINGCVDIGGADMNYVSFGSGKKNAVVLPGLSDGLLNVKGKARMLSGPYKKFFDDFTVYMFSRRNGLPMGHTIKDMAADQAKAIKNLGIGPAYVLGVSQGGMIAQYLTIDYPELVERLVLAVTAPGLNDTIRSCIDKWIEFAEKGDHKSLMIDTAEKSYSPEKLKKFRKFLPMLGMIGKPDSYDRFLANANAILGFDMRSELDKIACPTLIIGGDIDATVGTEAAGELHSLIAGSELYLYNGLGHAAYEEAPDFYDRVFGFLGEN